MLPTFLIIGAMKAGTTTMYRDLLHNQEIFMPRDKEPEALISDSVFSPPERAAYEDLFASSRPTQARGEASTAYSKRPTYAGVPERARKLLGSDVRIVYLVRNPIDRIVSQHYHEFAAGEAEADINAAVRQDGRYIAYSSYAFQLEPWLDAFGRDNVKAVKFEHYIQERVETVADVSAFLGVEPDVTGMAPEVNYRPSDTTPAITGVWERIQHSHVYQSLLRPLLGDEVRRRLRHAFLPKPPPRPSELDDATRAWLADRLTDDVEALPGLVGDASLSWELSGDRF